MCCSWLLLFLRAGRDNKVSKKEKGCISEIARNHILKIVGRSVAVSLLVFYEF